LKISGEPNPTSIDQASTFQSGVTVGKTNLTTTLQNTTFDMNASSIFNGNSTEIACRSFLNSPVFFDPEVNYASKHREIISRLNEFKNSLSLQKRGLSITPSPIGNEIDPLILQKNLSMPDDRKFNFLESVTTKPRTLTKFVKGG
jgi:hypothetical protein